MVDFKVEAPVPFKGVWCKPKFDVS